MNNEQRTENKEQFENIFKALPEQELPDGFHSKMMSRLSEIQEEEEKKVFDFKNLLRPKVLGTTFAGLAIAFISFGLGAGVNTNYDKMAQNEMSAPNSIYESNDFYADEAKPEMAKFSLSAQNKSFDVQMDGAKSNKGIVRSVPNTFTAADEAIKEEATPELYNEQNIEDTLKIIKTSQISVETDDFDTFVAYVTNMTRSSGGYVESSNSYIYNTHMRKDEQLKSGFIKIRIPKEQYEQVKTLVGDMADIISSSENAENVTERYVETESRIEMLEVQQKSLLRIMEKATKVEDMIKLEQRLNEIKTELEVYKNKIKNWDKLVAFSTININIREIRSKEKIEPVDKELSQKIKESFIESINNMKQRFENGLIWFAAEAPFVIMNLIKLAIVILIGFVVYKKVRKKLKEKDDDKNE